MKKINVTNNKIKLTKLNIIQYVYFGFLPVNVSLVNKDLPHHSIHLHRGPPSHHNSYTKKKLLSIIQKLSNHWAFIHTIRVFLIPGHRNHTKAYGALCSLLRLAQNQLNKYKKKNKKKNELDLFTRQSTDAYILRRCSDNINIA